MGRKKTGPTPEAPAPRGLDVSLFAGRPTLKDRKAASTKRQRQAAWRSFRMTVVAARTLRHFGLSVTSRSISATTGLLAANRGPLEEYFRAQGRVGLELVPVSEKTVLQNDMCACVLAAFSTAAAHIASRSKPRGHIPRGWHKRPRRWLIEQLAERTAERDDYKAKYEAAVLGQVPAPEEDSLIAMLKHYAEAEASARGITLSS